jgi:hypothetical protein
MSAGSTVITKRDTRDVGIAGKATNEQAESEEGPVEHRPAPFLRRRWRRENARFADSLEACNERKL